MEHKPGTQTCPCDRCRGYRARYARERRRKIREGQLRMVPISAIRPHLRALMDRGMPAWAIAADAGVSLPTVSRVMYADESLTVIAGSAAALSAVRYNTARLSAHSRVDVTGTRRRVQALALAGWPVRELTDRLGIEHSTFRVLRPQTRFVTVVRAAAVKKLFTELWEQAPPVRTEVERAIVVRTKRWARASGFSPALAWDDIDNPAEVPQLGARTAPRSAHDTLENIQFLKRFGMTNAGVAQRLRIAEHTVRDHLKDAS